jgi:hypothetical protein
MIYDLPITHEEFENRVLKISLSGGEKLQDLFEFSHQQK